MTVWVCNQCGGVFENDPNPENEKDTNEIVTKLEARGFHITNAWLDCDNEMVYVLSRRRRSTTRIATVEGTFVNGVPYEEYITAIGENNTNENECGWHTAEEILEMAKEF